MWKSESESQVHTQVLQNILVVTTSSQMYKYTALYMYDMPE